MTQSTIVSATRGDTLTFEVCPSHDGTACGCPRSDEQVLLAPHPVHTYPQIEPPNDWPNSGEPWREQAKTAKDVRQACDAWAAQCAREALLLVTAQTAAPPEPEDILATVAGVTGD